VETVPKEMPREAKTPVTGGFRVALTFDAEHPDRPHSARRGAERILDTLDARSVRATFFVQGRWALSEPTIARRISENGHLVGNHSMFHARMPLLSDDGLQTDVREAEDVIREITGADPRPWFRCPFGAGNDDPRVRGALERLGYRNVPWGVEPFDWEPAVTAEELVGSTIAEADDGAIVLLHTWPETTGAALPELISRLEDAGATFVTVDLLIGAGA
jgi:peptidoglycan/xylan/chitin deacetylase (PgdA/CDA1 family)